MKEITRKNIAGIWSAMPTPFTNKLELDRESVLRLVEHHMRLGIKGLFLSSLIGEGDLMSDSMKIDLAAEVVIPICNLKTSNVYYLHNFMEVTCDRDKNLQKSNISKSNRH